MFLYIVCISAILLLCALSKLELPPPPPPSSLTKRELKQYKDDKVEKSSKRKAIQQEVAKKRFQLKALSARAKERKQLEKTAQKKKQALEAKKAKEALAKQKAKEQKQQERLAQKEKLKLQKQKDQEKKKRQDAINKQKADALREKEQRAKQKELEKQQKIAALAKQKEKLAKKQEKHKRQKHVQKRQTELTEQKDRLTRLKEKIKRLDAKQKEMARKEKLAAKAKDPTPNEKTLLKLSKKLHSESTEINLTRTKKSLFSKLFKKSDSINIPPPPSKKTIDLPIPPEPSMSKKEQQKLDAQEKKFEKKRLAEIAKQEALERKQQLAEQKAAAKKEREEAKRIERDNQKALAKKKELEKQQKSLEEQTPSLDALEPKDSFFSKLFKKSDSIDIPPPPTSLSQREIAHYEHTELALEKKIERKLAKEESLNRKKRLSLLSQKIKEREQLKKEQLKKAKAQEKKQQALAAQKEKEALAKQQALEKKQQLEEAAKQKELAKKQRIEQKAAAKKEQEEQQLSRQKATQEIEDLTADLEPKESFFSKLFKKSDPLNIPPPPETISELPVPPAPSMSKKDKKNLIDIAKQREIEELFTDKPEEIVPIERKGEVKAAHPKREKNVQWLTSLFNNEPIEIEIDLNDKHLEQEPVPEPLIKRSAPSDTKEFQRHEAELAKERREIQKERQKLRHEISTIADFAIKKKMPKRRVKQLKSDLLSVKDEIDKTDETDRKVKEEIEQALLRIQDENLLFHPKQQNQVAGETQYLLDRIGDAREELMHLHLQEAKQIYLEIRTRYASLSPADQRIVFKELNDLYIERQKAQQLFTR